MNAVNPVPTGPAASPASGAEPSMEEILASIRRIIADDQSMPAHAGPAVPARLEPPSGLSSAGETEKVDRTTMAPAPSVDAPADTPELPPEHGILTTPQFVSPEGPASLLDTPHPLAPTSEMAGAVDVGDPMPPLAPAPEQPDLHESALRAMHEEPVRRETAPQEPPMTARDLPGEGPRGLFSATTSQSLAAAFNTLAISRLAADSQELRGLAQEMLRPLLKDWLDENLPGMVEGIIRDEIDRMSRRTR